MRLLVPVWDVWVRLGHWAIVVAIGFQWYSGEDIGLIDAHATVGILLAGWVVFRVLWGFVGPEYARFQSFTPKHPRALYESVKRLIQRQPEPTPGHSLTGGVGVYLLLGLIGLAALTGMASTDDIFFDGPLVSVLPRDWVDWASSSHHLITTLVFVTAALHLAAIAYHSLVIKEPLIAGMVHGRKPSHGVTLDRPRADTTATRIKGALLMATCLGGSYALFGLYLS
jgi:cytochrome b